MSRRPCAPRAPPYAGGPPPAIGPSARRQPPARTLASGGGTRGLARSRYRPMQVRAGQEEADSDQRRRQASDRGLLREVRRAPGTVRHRRPRRRPGARHRARRSTPTSGAGSFPRLCSSSSWSSSSCSTPPRRRRPGAKLEPDLRALGVAAVDASAHPAGVPRRPGARPDRAHAADRDGREAPPDRRCVTASSPTSTTWASPSPDLDAAVERYRRLLGAEPVAPRARGGPGRRGGVVRCGIVLRAAARRARTRHAGRALARDPRPRPAPRRLPGRRRRRGARAPPRRGGAAHRRGASAPVPGAPRSRSCTRARWAACSSSSCRNAASAGRARRRPTAGR